MSVSLVGVAINYLQSAPLDSHSQWEIILNLDGSGTTLVGDTEYEYQPGTIICIPPGVLHSKTSELRFRDIFIQVSEFIPSQDGSVMVLRDDEEKSMETLLFMALRTFHKKEQNNQLVLNSLFETMQQLLLSWSNRRTSKSVELFRNELITNFINPEFTISQAMQKTCYCSDHFRRCFKKEIGITPIEYLTTLRIDYAKRLLKQKNDIQMSIAEIAFSSGFYDYHYFSRIFKKAVGITPKQYAIARECEELV